MTPKEKAIQLIERFTPFTKERSLYVNVIKETNFNTNAKLCALLAVEEILEYTKEASLPMGGATGYDYDPYWQQVKTEIETL